MENEYIFFPVTKSGYWHNGIHRFQRDDTNIVFSKFLGKILIRSENVLLKQFPSIYPKFINKSEIEIRKPQFIEKKGYESQLLIELAELTNEEKEELLDAIGLSSIPVYILQKHTISFCAGLFSYYSFVRHLSKTYSFTKIKNEEYIFAHDKLGEYGESEGEKNMLHQEYFISSDSNFFKINAADMYDYCFIDGTVSRYQKQEQNCETLYFRKGTIFDVLNRKDEYRRYPHSLHLRVKKLLVCINEEYINKNFLRIEVSGSQIEVRTADNKQVSVIEVFVKNPRINKEEIKSVNVGGLKAITLNWKEDVYYEGDLFDLEGFWTETDVAKLQHWDDYVFTKGDVSLNKYNFAPDKKNFSRIGIIGSNFNVKWHKVSENCLCVFESADNDKFVQISNGVDEFYVSYDDIKYEKNYWKDFQKATCFFFEDDLEAYNPNDDEYKNCLDLQEIMKKKAVIDSVDQNIELEFFLEKNKDKTMRCAFQHISEWSQIEINPFKIDNFEETKDLWEKLHIWGTDGKSDSLPQDISDSSKFIYFHPQYFENWLFNLHQCYAEKLIAVQNVIMEDWRMKQGNCGMWCDYHTPDQTFCNQAVYETIKQVDGRFNNFTGRNDLLFPNYEKEESYPYRLSNYWCDVLEEQSRETGRTGICEISGEQAFYTAQLGYAVIAAWKNMSKEGSPHYVTVRPHDGGYPGAESVLVAHVGAGKSEVKRLNNAFLNIDEVKFYCNIYQDFI